MKICALTPIKPGTEIMCKEQSKKLFDAHFVYPDTSEEWSDWNNRLMLLTIAKMQGFVFVVHIDHDELFQEGVTRASIESDFKEMHRIIMGFKGWLRGVHHHARHLQAYLDEYCFRFNRSFMKEGVFENLLQRMMRTEPCPYKALVIS